MANANLNPWTESKVDTKNPDRGPLLILATGRADHTVPWAIANASYKRQKRNLSVTEIKKMPNRKVTATIDYFGRRSTAWCSTSSVCPGQRGRVPPRPPGASRALLQRCGISTALATARSSMTPLPPSQARRRSGCQLLDSALLERSSCVQRRGPQGEMIVRVDAQAGRRRRIVELVVAAEPERLRRPRPALGQVLVVGLPAVGRQGPHAPEAADPLTIAPCWRK